MHEWGVRVRWIVSCKSGVRGSCKSGVREWDEKVRCERGVQERGERVR